MTEGLEIAMFLESFDWSYDSEGLLNTCIILNGQASWFSLKTMRDRADLRALIAKARIWAN